MITRPIRTLVLVAAAVFLARCAGCGGSEEPSCPSGQIACHSACVDPASDPRNCGGCGFTCAVGATCASGACACPQGQEVCGPTCVDPATYASDPRNCGGCGIDCGVGACSGGACQCGAFQPCAPPSLPCVDSQNDPLNCGTGAAACGNRCPLAGDLCVGGHCQCPAGDIECPASNPTKCVDPATDASNCGGCGNACPGGASCISTICQCPGSLPDICEGACVNRSTDPSNCGTCGKVCPTGATCTGGSCPCPAGPVPGCGGSCCAGGSSCCGTACPTKHSNGLGQSFFDCNPLYVPATNTTEQAARAAALAWAPGGTFDATVFCDPYCVAIRPASGPGCAIWCYGQSNSAGRAKATDTAICQNACPFSGYATWQ